MSDGIELERICFHWMCSQLLKWYYLPRSKELERVGPSLQSSSLELPHKLKPCWDVRKSLERVKWVNRRKSNINGSWMKWLILIAWNIPFIIPFCHFNIGYSICSWCAIPFKIHLLLDTKFHSKSIPKSINFQFSRTSLLYPLNGFVSISSWRPTPSRSMHRLKCL